MFNVSKRVSKIFFHYGLYCASHPKSFITVTTLIILVFCIPLRNFNIYQAVPLEAVALSEAQYRALKSAQNPLNLNTSKTDKISFIIQIIYRSTVTPWQPDINFEDGLRANLNGSFLISQLIKSSARISSPETAYNDELTPDSNELELFCLKMQDLLTDKVNKLSPTGLSGQDLPTSRILRLPKPTLPINECALLSPSLIWKDSYNLFQLDDLELTERLQWTDSDGLIDALYGLPRRYTGMSKLQFRSLPVVNAFATTLVLNDFHTDFVSRLRENLLAAFPDSRYITKSHGSRKAMDILSRDAEISNAGGTEADNRLVFVVHYRGQNYLISCAPLIVIYIFLLLYIYCFATEVDMVKSKFGLAISACWTVVASFLVSMSLCVAVGLISPALRGADFFPYLIVLIGFDNVNVFIKSVVATPHDLPVKHRIAQGLAKEGWPITKNLLFAFCSIALGFFTFEPSIQEFCLLALVALTTDFFLQMFFFVPVLAIDIRRIRQTDPQVGKETAYTNTPAMSCPSFVCHTSQSKNSGLGNVLNSEAQKSSAILFDASLDRQSVHRARRAKSPTPSLKTSSSFLRCHRRTHSDAVCVAAHSRARAVRVWQKPRFFQRAFMTALIVWIVVFIYARPLSQSDEPAPNAELITTASSNDSHREIGRPQQGAAMVADVHESLTTEEESLFMMTSNRPHGIVLSWHMDTLWRFMAYDTWPAIARLYNFSLADHRLVILEPIYLASRIRADDARNLRPAVDQFKAPDDEYRSRGKSSASSTDGVTDEDDFDESASAKAVGEGAWAHAFSFGQKEALAALGQPLSGLLNWTHCLWTTGAMLLTSFLGGSFFLALTCVGMLIVHRKVTHFESHLCKEPVVRVQPLSISLMQPGSGYSISTNPQSSVNPVNRRDWIFACGSYAARSILPRSLSECACTSGSLVSTQHSVVAASLSGLHSTNCTSSHSGLDELSRGIRIWNAECGHLIDVMDRYSETAQAIRRTQANDRLPLRYSAVWCMSILPNCELLVGCSDGSLEVWDLQEHFLRQVVDLQSSRPISETTESTPSRTTPGFNRISRKGLFGGITTITVVHANCIFLGSDFGYVALLTAISTTDCGHVYAYEHSLSSLSPPPKTDYVVPSLRQWRIDRVWEAHTGAVTQIASQSLMPPTMALQALGSSRPTSATNGAASQVVSGNCSGVRRRDLPSDQERAFLAVSASEDGSIAIFETLKLRFQRFSWEPSPVLCIDLCHFTIAIGQGSGRVHLLKTCLFPPSSAGHIYNSESTTEVFKITHYDLNPRRSVLSSGSPVDPISDDGIRRRFSSDSLEDHLAAVVWIKLFPLKNYGQTSVGLPEPVSITGHHLSLTRVRLVTYSLDASVCVWRTDEPNQILKRFRANSPTFSLPTPILSSDSRVIFGDQNYLRLVNPWTAKYERSVCVLQPPSSANGVASSCRWAHGLGPIGTTKGSRWPCVVSVADGGRTLVLVPKATFFK